MKFVSSTKALTPLEVSFLHKGPEAVEIDRASLSHELTELMAASDPSVLESSQALYEAREAQNQIVSWQPEMMVMADSPKPRQTYMLSRGFYNVRLDAVDPSGLNQIFPFNPSFPRTVLASRSGCSIPKSAYRACVRQSHVAKAVRHRYRRNFGGFRDARIGPTNPQLLDWLAVDFMQSGWDIKRLNKMIVMSSGFRQSSEATDEMEKRIPRTFERVARDVVCLRNKLGTMRWPSADC